MERDCFSNKILVGANLDIFYTLSPPPERVGRNHSNFLHGYPSLFLKISPYIKRVVCVESCLLLSGFSLYFC